MAIKQDEKGRTHVDWELEGITPKMIDWFWANMEKGFALWHPIEHTDFYWHTQPEGDKVIGTIHVAPQVWSDGTMIKPHIRFENPADLPEDVTELIVYDHVMAVAGISLTGENFKEDDPALAYRVHQWESTDFGVRGISSAVPVEPEPLEKGLVWAKHGQEEINYWGDFLAQLYKLWTVIDNPRLNPYFSLKVVREGKKVRYAAL